MNQTPQRQPSGARLSCALLDMILVSPFPTSAIRVAGRLLLGCLLGLPAGTAVAAEGVIYYNRVATLDAPATLRRANSDGSGDQAVAVNLPAVLRPAASRDGRQLLLTSKDPGRPFKISNNVFNFDLATASVARITSFEDVLSTQGVLLTNDLGQVIGDRINSGYTINLPYHKAFSPDGTRVVVMNLRKTGTVSRDNIQSITNDPGTVGATSGRFPVVEIYRVADGQPEGSYVYLGIERTGFNQGGDGVDWHPTRNEIIATLSADIPATGNAGRTGMEGTLLAIFTASGPSGFVRKLTAPSGRADYYLDVGTLISTAYAEHDYAPAVAPDGLRVAYVRHTLRQDNRYDGAGIAPLPALCSIRVINYDGTGDREILPLAEGVWVTKLSWSPEGSEIAFDLAPQTVINGWNSLLGDVSRSEIAVVNADGTNPRKLIPAPAAFPSWTVGGNRNPPPRPTVRAARNAKKVEIQVDGLVPGRQINILGTTDLKGWNVVHGFVASAASETILVTPAPGSPASFYRVQVP